jgi:hypothetical protein
MPIFDASGWMMPSWANVYFDLIFVGLKVLARGFLNH